MVLLLSVHESIYYPALTASSVSLTPPCWVDRPNQLHAAHLWASLFNLTGFFSALCQIVLCCSLGCLKTIFPCLPAWPELTLDLDFCLSPADFVYTWVNLCYIKEDLCSWIDEKFRILDFRMDFCLTTVLCRPFDRWCDIPSPLETQFPLALTSVHSALFGSFFPFPLVFLQCHAAWLHQALNLPSCNPDCCTRCQVNTRQICLQFSEWLEVWSEQKQRTYLTSLKPSMWARIEFILPCPILVHDRLQWFVHFIGKHV